MIFLNPSILLGLLAASIPIIIHIINFRKLQKVEFSTLSFLKELQKSKIKKIKIKQWLLLLLRTLIIILLVLSFAKPTLENTYFAGTASVAKSSTAFILDNSFSMSYVGNEGSIFNKSKSEAKKIVSQMENDDQFYFIISSDSVINTKNKKEALTIIDNLKISFLTEPLIKKLNKANSILMSSKNINKEIFLFSDFRKNTLSNSLLTDSSSNIVYDNINLYSFDMSLKDENNISVSNLKLESSIIEPNKQINFSVLVNNYSNSKVDNVTASLFLNKERVSQQPITLLPNEHKKYNFKTTLKNTGLMEAKVKLDDDNILQDNENYLSFYIPEKINILIVYDKISDTKFLNAAILSSSTDNNIKVTLASSKSIFNLSLNDIVFVITKETSALKKITNYLNAGGKAIVIPPENINLNDIIKLNSLISFPKATNIIQVKNKESNYSEFSSIKFDHPIFTNLFNNENKNKIESPLFFKYIKLSQNSFVNKIISLTDGSTFLGEYNFTDGRIIFFNSSLTLNWSDLPLKGIFAPLINKIIFYLLSNNTSSKSYTIGESIPINIHNLNFPQIDVKLPHGSDKLNIEGITNNKIDYNLTLIPGNYKFYSNNKIIMYASVNTDPTESDLADFDYNNRDKIFKNIYGNNILNINMQENYLQIIKQARYGTELWKIFLIIALLIALAEMFIARNTKKDLMEFDN